MTEVLPTLEFEDNWETEGSRKWENLDHDEIVYRFKLLKDHLWDLQGQLDKMVKNNEVKKTEDLFLQVCVDDLSLAGWVNKFRELNKDSFEKYSDSSKPSWYHDLDDKQKRNYDLCLRYYKDMAKLQAPFASLNKLISELLGEYMFRVINKIQTIKTNLADVGITNKYYATIQVDLLHVSDIIKKDRSALESSLGGSSLEYYKANRDKLDTSSLKQGYEKVRRQTYVKDFQQGWLATELGIFSDGSCYVKADTAAKAKAVDKYTELICVMEHNIDLLKKHVEKCDEILNKEITPAKQEADTQMVSDTLYVLSAVVECIKRNMNIALEEFDLYKKADPNTAPYCFMKMLSIYDSIKPKYHLKPRKIDPWQGGTDYFDLYVMMAASISAHCDYFVEQCGKQEW